jgi:hypothetical protein
VPGTSQEIIALVNAFVTDAASPDVLSGWRWDDGEIITEGERNDVLALYLYALGRRRKRHQGGPQRKAMRLLRGLLSPTQRRDLSRLRYFHVAAPSGTTYRLDPRRGHAELVERHGRRYFVRRAYCLHDEDDAGKLPPADVTVAHLLLLLVDEAAFLAAANMTPRDDQLWNRDYLRRIRARTPSSPSGYRAVAVRPN